MDPTLRLALALLAGAAFGVGAWRAGALSRSGAVAGGLFGAELVAFASPPWVAAAVTFFVLSSALSRLGAGRKREAEALAEKGSQRDAGQVLACI